MDSLCLSERECVARTSTGPAITAKPGTLCPRCIDDIQRCLTELPPYRELLVQFIAKPIGGGGGGPRVSGSTDPSTPVNIAVVDLLDWIDEVVASSGGWGVQVRDLVQRPAERCGPDGWPVYLTGVSRALAIRRVHGKAEALAGLSKVWERRRAPCPECELPTLGTWVGSGLVQCTNSDCQGVLDQDEYEKYCILKASERKK